MSKILWKIQKVVRRGDYLNAVVPNHPRATRYGYVLMHRIVMENELGRLLRDDEIVHHINEDKHDNRIENLKVMSKGDHTRLHHRPKTVVSLTCGECRQEFTRERRQTNFIPSKRHQEHFCSRQCSGMYNSRKRVRC